MANPSISIPDSLQGDVDAIAHARSEPGDRVARSEVIRDALELYVDDHRDEVEAGRRGETDAFGPPRTTDETA